MSSELAGIGGYASLMKTQKNPLNGQTKSMLETLFAAEELANKGQEEQALKMLRVHGLPITSFTVDKHGFSAEMDNGSHWRLGGDGVTVWDTAEFQWRKATQADTEALKTPASTEQATATPPTGL